MRVNGGAYDFFVIQREFTTRGVGNMTKWALQRDMLPFLSTADESSAVSGSEVARHRAPESDLRLSTEIIEVLSRLIPDLTRLIAGKSEETLRLPDQDGGWGVVDVISHLLDWERVNHDRIHRLLMEDSPVFPDFDDSLWSVEHHYRDNVSVDVLDELHEHRDVLVEELKNLHPDDWERTGNLEGTGEITLRWLMHSVCNHDLKHLTQARGILA